MRKIKHFRPFSYRYDNRSNRGAITVVSDLIYGDGKFPIAVEFAVSYCSPKDQFIKRDGVAIADQRLKTKDARFYRMIPITANRKLHYYELEDLIAVNVMHSMDAPKWARELLTA